MSEANQSLLNAVECSRETCKKVQEQIQKALRTVSKLEKGVGNELLAKIRLQVDAGFEWREAVKSIVEAYKRDVFYNSCDFNQCNFQVPCYPCISKKKLEDALQKSHREVDTITLTKELAKIESETLNFIEFSTLLEKLVEWETIVGSVFNDHCVFQAPCFPSISKEKLQHALGQLHIKVDDMTLENKLEEFGIEKKETMTLNEFQSLLEKPSPLVEWAKSLPLAEIVADAVPRNPKEGADVKRGILRRVAGLSQDEISTMCQGMVCGLEKLLSESSKQLKTAFDAMEKNVEERDDQSKFAVVPMSCGSIQNFHEGIEGRTGYPSLNFFKAMLREHCETKGSDVEFTTGNYKITTTSKKEWNLVVKQDKTGLTTAEKAHGRIIPNIEELMEREITTQAKLLKEEVIETVMYTGPMFQLYNIALRQFPKDQYEQLRDSNSLYTTSIYVLVSAVQNIARAVKLPAGTRLYRGLGGDKEFQPFFYKSDEKGCRGMVEWGFMSTTKSKAVALQYSGVREGKPCPAILDIVSGAVDRGAVITEFSQYPREEECLFAPCSFLEPQGGEALEVTQDGVVSQIHIRLNMNLKAKTCEELREGKNQLHLSSFKNLINEIKGELAELAPKIRKAKDSWYDDKFVQKGSMRGSV